MPICPCCTLPTGAELSAAAALPSELPAGATGMEPGRPARSITVTAIAINPARVRDLGPGASLADVLAERARAAAQGPWVPACGGSETVTTYRTGRRLLYCWQPSTGRHAYLDTSTDLILSDEEARDAIGF